MQDSKSFDAHFLPPVAYPRRQTLEALVARYTDGLIHVLENRSLHPPRTYGFEYEFLPEKSMDLDHMGKLYDFLPKLGYARAKSSFVLPSGLFVTFEPGGQIEFCSVPMAGWCPEVFFSMMEGIEETVAAIEAGLGIRYLAVGYLPGRGEAPLCLTGDRYVDMHARMPLCGARGREMMKGTAAIHLHVGIDALDKIVPLFSKLRVLSQGAEFGPSFERKAIWRNTDPTRCGDPFGGDIDGLSVRELFEAYVRFALLAEGFSDSVPFAQNKDLSFERFLNHITTLFTDVRLNLKGPSIELRTPDSLPMEQFEGKWRRFIGILGSV